MHTSKEYPIDAATLDTVDEFLDRVAKVFSVKSAVLFGSRARGNFHPDSDADVAVFLRGEHGQFMSAKMVMADMAFDVLLDTGIRVEAIPLWEDDWRNPETHSNPRLLRNIEHDGVIVR